MHLHQKIVIHHGYKHCRGGVKFSLLSRALQKLVLDEGCDTIEKDLSHYIMATMLLGPTMQLEIEGIVLFLSGEHMHGNTIAFISGEHLFNIDVLEHLLFLPKY